MTNYQLAMREIALDTETTGISPQAGHRVVEIGCVEMQGRVRTGNMLHFYLNPQRDMPPEAQRVHGLSSEFLADKPLFSDIADKFLNFIADSPLVIHNAPFDMGFLNAELQRAGRAMLPMERAVDTVLIAREKFPGSPANLDALCRRFEIDLSARGFHGALLDAELLSEVYLELMGGRQSTLILESVTQRLQHSKGNSPVPQYFAYRQFAVSATEQEAHEAFLKSLKNPLWLKEAQS